ncbi:isoprenylcysteine carboxylmethyltransferase family protein [Desulfobulbus sp. US4]|nr:isoprenylcysteine carboxylmethyltransferase family protein [Desulfobulbus sp. US4]
MKKLKEFARNNWQLLLNIYIFLNIAGYCVWSGYRIWQEGRFDFVEVSFTVQNLLMLAFILLRRKHKALNRNFLHQAVALFAFFSGLLFIGQEATGSASAQSVSSWTIFISNILGVVTLLNLGRSFGILIAFRKVKTGGLYSIVRHPMYGTDILLRIGFIISHHSPFTLALFTVSTGAYVVRALLEERFLLQEPEYQKYAKRVRYRFIPFVF